MPFIFFYFLYIRLLLSNIRQCISKSGFVVFIARIYLSSYTHNIILTCLYLQGLKKVRKGSSHFLSPFINYVQSYHHSTAKAIHFRGGSDPEIAREIINPALYSFYLSRMLPRNFEPSATIPLTQIS